MTTAILDRPLTAARPAAGDPGAITAPAVVRVLYMCAAAHAREVRGEASGSLHAACRGTAWNPSRALGRLMDPDGRFQPGLHRCRCACHRTRNGAARAGE